MARFTFLEVHLDGSQFTANAPFSGEESGKSGKSITEEIEDESSSEGGSSMLGPVLGLVAIAGFVAVARRILSRRRGERDESRETEPIIAD